MDNEKQPQPKTTDGRTVAPGTDAAPARPKAQSEIGPTTYGEGGVTQHGADDAETKAAYAAGHPSQGIAAAREGTTGQPVRPGFSNPQGATAAPATAAAGQPGVVRVRMTQDRDGRTTGQIVDLPEAEAQALIDQGVAQRL